MSEKPLSQAPTRAENDAAPLEFEEADIYLQKASSHLTSYAEGHATAQAALAESRKPLEKAPTLFVELQRFGGRLTEERHNLASSEL